MDIAFLGRMARVECLDFLKSELQFPPLNSKLLFISYDRSYLTDFAILLQKMGLDYESSCEEHETKVAESIAKSSATCILTEPFFIRQCLDADAMPMMSTLVIDNINHFLNTYFPRDFLYDLIKSQGSSVQVVFTSEDPLSAETLSWLPRFFRTNYPHISLMHKQWGRPRLVSIAFPVQILHEHDSDDDDSGPCLRCPELERKQNTKIIFAINTCDGIHVICATCAKYNPKWIVCKQTVWWQGLHETCFLCLSPIQISSPSQRTCFDCFSVPFDYWWTLVTPSCSSDFVFKKIDKFLLKDLWMLINQYCFPYTQKVFQSHLYLDKRESNRKLFHSGLFPNSRRAVVHVTGYDSQDQYYNQYFCYKSLGTIVCRRFTHITLC